MEKVSYMQVVQRFGENQQPTDFGLEDLNNKNTPNIEGSKTRNNLQRRYLEVKKQEAAFESQLSKLKHNKQCTHDVFRE